MNEREEGFSPEERGNGTRGEREQGIWKEWLAWQEKAQKWEISPQELIEKGAQLVMEYYGTRNAEGQLPVEEVREKVEEFKEIVDEVILRLKRTPLFGKMRRTKIGRRERDRREFGLNMRNLLEWLLVGIVAFVKAQTTIDNSLNPRIKVIPPEGKTLPPSVIESYAQYQGVRVRVEQLVRNEVRSILESVSDGKTDEIDEEEITRVLLIVKGLFYFKFSDDKNNREKVFSLVSEGLLAVSQGRIEEGEEKLMKLVMTYPEAAPRIALALVLGKEVDEVGIEDRDSLVRERESLKVREEEERIKEQVEEQLRRMKEVIAEKLERIKREYEERDWVEKKIGQWVVVQQGNQVLIRRITAVREYDEHMITGAKMCQDNERWDIRAEWGKVRVLKVVVTTYRWNWAEGRIETSSSRMYPSTLRGEIEGARLCLGERLGKRIDEEGELQIYEGEDPKEVIRGFLKDINE